MRKKRIRKKKMTHQECYAGSMQRRFYVVESIKQEDVKAKFEGDVLRFSFSKEGERKLPEKKQILIEG